MPLIAILENMVPCDCVPSGDGYRCTCSCGEVLPSSSPRLFHVCDPRKRNLPPPKLTPQLALVRTDTVSFLQKAKNFAVATAKHVAAGMPMASDEEIIRRHDICLGCEFFKDNACSKCGCPVYRDKKFISKLAWADQSCPVGKW